MLKICKISACPNGTLGLHLSRAPWDPYPWVSGIQEGSSAEDAGMRVGDTVLEFNGNDVLGQKIFEIATKIREHWQSGATDVTVVIWRNETEPDSCCSDENDCEDVDEEEGEGVENALDNSDSETAMVEGRRKRAHQHQHQQHSSINQQSLQKFATCLQHIAQLLECPVCLEVIRPPGWQCCNGHVLCNNCRSRSVKCPVCRVPLGPRGRCLLADKLFTVLAESFPCDGVRSNRNSPKEKRKCSPELKGRPTASATTREQQGDRNQQQQQQQQQKQKIKAKEMQQQDKKKVKTTAAGSQKNVTNGKVVAQECTTVEEVQQVNSATDNINNNKQEDSKKQSAKVEGALDGNLLHGCHWQWRRSRLRLCKEAQQQQ